MQGKQKAESSEDELIIFILYRGQIESFIPLLKTIRKTINEKIGVEIQNVIPVKRIPKTTSGKVQRHLLNDGNIAGEYDTLINEINATLNQSASINNSKNTSSLENQVLQICQTTVPEKNITVDDNLFEIGISSLALAEIHEQLDELFPGKVDISDLFDNPTVGELSAFLGKVTTNKTNDKDNYTAAP